MPSKSSRPTIEELNPFFEVSAKEFWDNYSDYLNHQKIARSKTKRREFFPTLITSKITCLPANNNSMLFWFADYSLDKQERRSLLKNQQQYTDSGLEFTRDLFNLAIDPNPEHAMEFQRNYPLVEFSLMALEDLQKNNTQQVQPGELFVYHLTKMNKMLHVDANRSYYYFIKERIMDDISRIVLDIEGNISTTMRILIALLSFWGGKFILREFKPARQDSFLSQVKEAFKSEDEYQKWVDMKLLTVN